MDLYLTEWYASSSVTSFTSTLGGSSLSSSSLSPVVLLSVVVVPDPKLKPVGLAAELLPKVNPALLLPPNENPDFCSVWGADDEAKVNPVVAVEFDFIPSEAAVPKVKPVDNLVSSVLLPNENPDGLSGEVFSSALLPNEKPLLPPSGFVFPKVKEGAALLLAKPTEPDPNFTGSAAFSEEATFPKRPPKSGLLLEESELELESSCASSLPE